MDILSLIRVVKNDLRSQEIGDLMVALASFGTDEEVEASTLPAEIRTVYRLAAAKLEEEYTARKAEEEAGLEHRKAISAIRSAAGKKGGRPRSSEPEESNKKQKKQKNQFAFLLSDDKKDEQTNTSKENTNCIDNKQVDKILENPKKQINQKKQIGFLLLEGENTAKIPQNEEESSLFPPTTPILTPEEENREKEIRDTKVSLTKKKTETDFSFVEDPRYLPILEKWLAYKRQRGESYKPIGLKGCYKKMVELSNGDPEFADKYMVEFSIANNYAGLFVDKTQQREKVARKRESDTPLDVNSRYNPDDFNF